MKTARRILVGIAILLVIVLITVAPDSNAADNTSSPDTQVFVSEAVTPELSRPVRDIPPRTLEQTLNREINPIRNPGLFMDDLGLTGSNTTDQDPLVALSHMETGYTPSPIFTFEGLGTDGYTPPDTMGEVGPNHYVQMVNVSFAIYDKSGNVVQADTPYTDLFAGSGLTYCSSQNDGDPVVLWDSMADRWLLSQFAVSSSPEHMCVAISQTSDPTGAYYLYEFQVPDFPDYFKFGVWPDAYYMGTNTGYPNQYYAYAFDRDAMLAGLPATYQYSNGHPNFLLPADLDGSNEPPTGSPGYFYTMLDGGYPNHPAGVDRLVLYEFNVDWDTPANSTFGIAQELPIADYNYTTCGFFAGDCIPQPDTTQRLDAVDPWPMWRFAYRNLNAYEAMVGNFTVDVDGTDHAGIRWFELQKEGASSWSLHQEGTHVPDSDHRWMGSIAMDGSGNIALGYSVSSETTYPSLRYATRLRSDVLGTLQAEASLYAGSGSQTGPYDRWGDYSSMSVDPADECTFWYTGEYHDVTDTSFNWNTRIGTFRLPECSGTLGPDFSISADPTALAVCAPDSAVYDLTLNYLSGFDGTVDLSAYNVPSGGVATIVPSTLVTPTTDSLLTITTGAVAYGTYDVDIVGVSVPTPTHTTTVGLDVYTAVPAVTTLVAPANNAVDVSLVPTFEWSGVAQAQSYYLEVATDMAFTNVVYSATVNGTSHDMTGTNLDPEETYYWRVTASNICGDGTTSAVYSFTTVLLFCDYPGAAIDDNSTTSVSLTSSRNDAIADLNVYVNITHTYIGDLDITLTHEATGAQVILLPSSFSCSGDDIDASFDDEAGTAITCGASVPALSGSVIPSESLAAFDFDLLAGTWRLDVHDGAGGDTGTVNQWCLEPQFATSVGTVTGTVTDANTSDPIEGATVTLDNGTSTYSALTNVDGEYIRPVSGDTYTVTAEMSNYVTGVVTGITVTDGMTTTQDFALDAGMLDSSVANMSAIVELGSSTTLPWTLYNVGTAELSFDIRTVDNGYNPGLTPLIGEDILVVAADSTAAAAMEAALTNLGYTYLQVSSTEFAAMTVADLLTYQAVFHAGNTAIASETQIVAYLDAGGSLYISDNDLGYSNNGEVFYYEYLQANYVSDDPGINIIEGEDFMAGLSADISADLWPDDFTVAAEGTRILSYQGGNAAGVAVNRNGYKAVYTSFDFDDIADTADEEAFIDAITSYLTGGNVFWLSTDVVTGTLGIGGNQGVVVSLDAGVVALAGNYYGDLVVRNDTPYGDMVIPVTMTVECPTCGTLSGEITDDFTGDPLAASVQITNTGGFDLTIDGTAYSIDLPPDTYYLSVTAPDYLPETATAVVTQGVTTTTDFALTPAFAALIYDPAAIEEYMEIGDIVTNTVTVTNTGTIDLDFTASIGGFGGPGMVSVQKVDSNVSTARSNAPAPVVTSAADCAAFENYAGREPAGYAEFCATNKSLLEPVASNGLLDPTDIGYAQDIGFISDNFVSFTLNDFTGQTVVGTTTNVYYGMDFDAAGTTLYALEDTTGMLGSIDVATGAFTPLVSAPAPGGNWTGLSIDPTDNTFYASTATSLYTLDPATGVSTLVGNYFNTTLMIDIAIGPDGAMYGHAIDTDAIYTINKATGADALVGLTGQNANYAQGMDFDNSDGTLYIFLYIGSGANVFGTVDLTTGAVTPLASSAPQGEFEGAIPAPGSAGPTDWAYLTDNGGTLIPGETATFDVIFDATGLYQVGDYTAELNFTGNFENEVPTMPLTMHISCPTCGILNGSITDYDTGDPLAADIHVTGPNAFDVTVNGESYALAVPAGTYDFEVMVDGYFSGTATVDAITGVTVTTDIALIPQIGRLEHSHDEMSHTMLLNQIVTTTMMVENTGYVPFTFDMSFLPMAGHTVLDNLVADGSFEDGTPNSYWTEASTNFGTPICDEANCGLGTGTGPRTGTFWTWFGGIAGYEEGSVSQDVTIPAGTATLNFYLEQIVCDTASDYMEVTLDGNQVFYTDGGNAICGVLGYSLQSADVSAYADGGTHTLEFHSEIFANGGTGTNFFVDDVEIVAEAGAVDWVYAVPTSATVDPGESIAISVIFNSHMVTETGVYNAQMAFSGDFDNTVDNMPMEMTIVDHLYLYLPVVLKP
ncbi:MAG: carboxypeptidase regulatory-like domain-containing protein [Ardenticatenaceae bacterium]|nr:carboxypeptidase regulatory-like domain-containing protein [Ardenticatenaceae bacterium]MCB9004040.1 carboxypeptidase regulatory-like domain-containing protein [Ardenticatenaceae bacterium]